MFNAWKLKRFNSAFYRLMKFYPVFTAYRNATLKRIALKPSIISVPFVTSFVVYGASVSKSSDSKLEDLLKKADALFEDDHCAEICKILEPLKNEKNDEILWRLGRAVYTLSKGETDEKRKKEMIFEANEYIAQALHLNENNFAVHKWMSILLNATSMYSGIKAKITQAHVMKQHMLRAVELNPKDATVIHMLGTWCFEVAEMPWYQRKIASTIFATPPNSSFQEALEFFLRAEEVDPNFYSMNFLMLGKTYLKMNDNEKAAHYLKLARDYPQKTYDDMKAKTEAEQLLKQLK